MSKSTPLFILGLRATFLSSLFLLSSDLAIEVIIDRLNLAEWGMVIFSGIHHSLYLKLLPFQRQAHCFYIFSDAAQIALCIVLIFTCANHESIATLIELDLIYIRHLEAYRSNDSLL